ncbi:tumor susceptibility gene 101 protein-like [Sinocyclocheilus grahami]|nr:PREDICTED: tumor susceptibility gene 101 protein-like [Sinocyclocheilus grahami]
MTVTPVRDLRRILPRTYNHRREVLSEIATVVSQHQHLQPVLERFVFNDGTAKTLAGLTGTIKVFYEGKHYNIPVSLWLKESYPRTAPICYVKPTPEMLIMTGRHVDSSGEILMPYLDEWRHTQCDLHSLIQVMKAVFSEVPPLRMRLYPEDCDYIRVLFSIFQQYKYRDLTVREITNVISQYKDLKPVMDAYVFNDGSSRDLMSLTGTVPVSYRGNVYNIPVCLWLLDTYPYNPPICFVKPTSAMMIKTGKHIDANGKIYLPYLHEWKHPQSDLYGLIQVMIVVFGEEPPVFSRPTTQPPYQAFQAAGPPNQSYMPGMPAVSPYGPNPNPCGYPGYPYPGGNAYPATGGPAHYTSQTPVTTVGPSRDGTIGEDTIRASLISAVSDKLRWRMKEEMDRAQAELDALKRTEEDLKKGHQKLEDMVSRLDQEAAEVDRNIELLKKKDVELSEALEKMENQSENNDIDDVIIPTAPLYKQILNLYAEENAIEDTIFYLGEALRRGVIDLEVFLKHVRLLSRKQFQLRALMQKARKTAGLSDLY